MRYYGQLVFEIDATDAEQAKSILEEAVGHVSNIPGVADVYVKDDPEDES